MEVLVYFTEEHLKRVLLLRGASLSQSFHSHLEKSLLFKNKFALKIKKDWAGEIKAVQQVTILSPAKYCYLLEKYTHLGLKAE